MRKSRAKQKPKEWDCPHGKQWGIGCQECISQEAADRQQSSPLGHVGAMTELPREEIHKPEGQSVTWYYGFDWATDANPEAEKMHNEDYAESKGIDFLSTEWEDFQKGSEYALNEIEEDQQYG